MKPLSETEFTQAEQLCAALLQVAKPDEVVNILHLHQRLKQIYENQKDQRDQLEYLQNLTKQTGR